MEAGAIHGGSTPRYETLGEPQRRSEPIGTEHGVVSAVYEQHRTGNEAGFVAEQEESGIADVFGFARSFGGDLFDEFREGIFAEVGGHVRFNVARSDDVHGNVTGCQFLCQRFREPDDPGFGGGVVGLSCLST